MNTDKKRRSALSIMGSLIGLVKPLLHIMLAAIVLGTAGYLCAIFLTILAGQVVVHGLAVSVGTEFGGSGGAGLAGTVFSGSAGTGTVTVKNMWLINTPVKTIIMVMSSAWNPALCRAVLQPFYCV